MRSTRALTAHAAVLAAVVASLLGSCTSLDDYAAPSSRPYVGVVLGQSDSSCDAGTGCSFLRRGFRSDTELVLTLDPDNLDTAPGTISTRMVGGAAEPCATTFSDEPLLAIVPLAHDTLSQLEFPGNGRLRTFVFAISPSTGPLAGRDALAFVSLMRGGDVEVRILAGSGDSDCAPTDCAAFNSQSCDFFGVFHMTRPEAP